MKIYLIFILAFLFALSNLSASASWNTQYTYDNHEDASINSSLWDQNSPAGCSGRYSFFETSGKITVRVDTDSTCHDVEASITSNNFPSLNSLENITIRAILDNGYSYFYVFGNLIKNSADTSVWTFYRLSNGSFSYYDDGSYVGQIVPSNNIVKIDTHVTTDGGPVDTSLDYEYYTYGNTTLNMVENYPLDNEKIYKNEDVLFNITSSTLINELSNISLYVDDLLIETKNISGTTNQTLFYEDLSSYLNGIHNYSVYVCDSGGNCKFSDSTDFELQPIKINSVTYNQSVYETSSQSFILNSSQSLSSVTLIYDGTPYSASYSGGVYTKTMDIPEVSSIQNKTFYWSIVYSGDTIISREYNQTINPIYFGLCNSTYNVPFLNLTFKDESTLTSTEAKISYSNFEYWLGGGSITKTYSLINNTNNSIYSLCFSPSGGSLNLDMYIQYSNDNSPQRIYDPAATTFTNSTTVEELYLLESEDGLYVTFQVINPSNQVLSGVEVVVSRSISGVETIIAQGTTGAAGSVTFWLNPNFVHTANFSKEGFNYQSIEQAFTNSEYTVTMGGGSSQQADDYTKGIIMSVFPSITQTLYNGTTYNFNFTINSSYWDIESYGFILRLNNGTILASESDTGTGTLDTDFNTANYTYIIMDYYWIVNGTNMTRTVSWIVISSGYDDWSIKTFFTDFNNYIDSGLFGIDEFGKKLIIFLVLFITVGALNYKYNVGSEVGTIAIVFGTIFFLDVAVEIIPNPVQAIPHFFTFVSALALIALIIREGSR